MIKGAKVQNNNNKKSNFAATTLVPKTKQNSTKTATIIV